MKLKNSTYEIANLLSKKDLEMLKSIYLLRCLTVKQIYNKFYKNDFTFDEFIVYKIQKLIDYNLIEEQSFKSDSIAIFLTSEGVELIRYHCNLPTNTYDASKKVVKRGYYRAGELKILPKLINHQVHLNQFVLDFDKYMFKLNKMVNGSINLKYRYYDEKYVSQYASIRPDGLIQLLDIDFFLEMDMATESKKQLEEKWKHYRAFLSNNEYKHKEKKIVVLFLIDGTNSVENRKKIIRHSISNIMIDVLDSDFEIFIGTRNEILNLMFQHFIPKILQSCFEMEKIKSILIENKFHVSNGYMLKKHLLNTEFEYYIRKIKNNNSILVENGKVQEFIVDEYLYRPFSVLTKIAYHQRNSSCFKHDFDRDICYLVLVNDIDSLYNDLKVVDLIGVKGVYFTTLDRLKTKPFYEAIFQIDSLGNLHHFANFGLRERIFEYNLEDKKNT